MKLISILILRRKNLIKKKKGRASTIINGHIFDLTSRDICTIDVSTSGSKNRSPKGDQSLLGRLLELRIIFLIAPQFLSAVEVTASLPFVIKIL